MADDEEKEQDTRSWWRKKTNWGFAALAVAGTLAAIPGAPVIVTVGAVSVTTAVVSTALQYIGTALMGYGLADRVKKRTGQ